MRKFLIASAVALAASLGAGAAAQAASVNVQIGTRDHYVPRHHHRMERYHTPRKTVVIREGRRNHADCYIKKTVKYRHGERIVKRVRICR
ncbi:hypothetical protein LQ948_07535 [Jiella sp. MQZ9-1]|uniref:Uncharacterized protein n=1 Tax=Jiella flava TaxID=2816857 RepID=A0A939FYN7_9HYPH|nr:hypothetical protein [Jiella flava]MBO0662636.1 hypothetical protein [Jiella flava]MCD2471058.1 hypothetical protein [Jiella flava]